MHPYLLIPLLSGIAAAAIASAIVARDPGQRANRLVALVLGCSVWWSVCEVIWNASDDAGVAVRWIRISSLGWMWTGPLSLDLYLEVLADSRARLARLRPFAYAAAPVTMALYVGTPWCISGAIPTSWGWGILFGPLFPVAFLPTLICVSLVLVRLRRLLADDSSPSERRQVRWFMAAVALPLTLSSITDVLLPHLGLHVPRVGSSSLLVIGAVVAVSVSRHGYFLLAPGAFTQEILESLRDGVALLGADGRIRSCNGGIARLLGLSREDLRGRSIAELLPDLPAAGGCEIRDLEVELHPTSGPPIPVSVSSSPLRDERGGPLGSVLAVHDARDVVSLRNRLVQAGRLAAVGELAAGIAHEIGNPIVFARSNLVQLRQHWELVAEEAAKVEPPGGLDALLAEGEELIEESVEGIDRIGAIVRDVGAFSHAGRGRSEMVDLNALVENTANVAALRSSVTVERCYGDLPPVRCAPHQLRQVFLSLIFNALQAVGDSGRIRLVTQAVRDSVIVRVEDDGCGMAPEVLERIFDPFFTTRPAGEGTGLGLALGYQIVRSHGGEIDVQSEPGRGTTVRVRLPAAGR